MRCHHFDARRCRSCTLMGVAYDDQTARKDRSVRAALALPDAVWSLPQHSAESGFRNKAKFVVGGRAGAVTLGILDAQQTGVDIRDCGLLEPPLAALMQPLAQTLDALEIEPYDVPRRRGEAKYVIATTAPDGTAMVRFVLRSDRHVGALREALPRLQEAHPGLRVVSVNVHPEHKAVLEGDTEVLLTEHDRLPMPVNDVTLLIGPRSFFQTNTAVAAALYRQAREWVGEVGSVWDLYCGVGGFAVHLLGQARSVTGIEVTPEAIELAQAAVDSLPPGRTPLARCRFVVADATQFAQTRPAPDLVVVNPPRRGLSEELCRWLNGSSVARIVYSSCNVVTLARDLGRLKWFGVRAARLFDMFPQTEHHEVMVLLEREVTATAGRRRRQHPPRGAR